LLTVFIRNSIFEFEKRLDGRKINDRRNVSIELSRTEMSSKSEVTIGTTFILCIVSCMITSPYSDRPIEGRIQFNCEGSILSSSNGISHSDISRLLERSLKDSDAIDTESLCIISGEKVWQITCEIKILDASGGNLIDACMLAAISALKAFRKPEISIVSSIVDDFEDEKNITKKSFNEIFVHHSNDREPLPLAILHSPISVTIGILKLSNSRAIGKTTVIFLQLYLIEQMNSFTI
jgi:exosome complex component RRP45